MRMDLRAGTECEDQYFAVNLSQRASTQNSACQGSRQRIRALTEMYYLGNNRQWWLSPIRYKAV